MSVKFSNKSSKKQIAHRDINNYNNHSDPIPILLIFCLFVFLVFAFVLVFIVLSGLWRDPSEQTWNEQNFDIFVEPVEFFEAQNTILISSDRGSIFPFSARKESSFNFEDVPDVSPTDFIEIAKIASVENWNDTITYSWVNTQSDRITFSDRLSINSPGISDRQASLNLSRDRATNLQSFFQQYRDLQQSSLLSERNLASSLGNFAKNPTGKILGHHEGVALQMQPNTDEFSTQIAIAQIPNPTFLPSPKNDPKAVPESTNGWSAILMFRLAIALISRRKK